MEVHAAGPAFLCRNGPKGFIHKLSDFKISNNKSKKTMTEIQNLNQETIVLNRFRVWSLWFIAIYLPAVFLLGCLDSVIFNTKLPRQSQPTLTLRIEDPAVRRRRTRF